MDRSCTDDGVPLTIGSNVTVGHMVMLHGCTIGDGKPHRHQCGRPQQGGDRQELHHRCEHAHSEGKVIPDRSLVVGSPGRIIRQLTDDDLQRLMENADGYVGNAPLRRRAGRHHPCQG